jgi:outer membrane receptor for ferrienterochelin and colicin
MDMNKLVNLGDLDIYGVDAQGKVRVYDEIEVGGSYNYLRAKSETSDDPLDRLPHHRAEGWISVGLPASITALARVRYTGEAIDRAMPTDDYFLVEGTVTARIGEYLGVLKVDDALDVQPETRTGFHSPGRTISVVLQGMWE